MVVMNAHRKFALVVKRERGQVALIQLAAGALRVTRLSEAAFSANWIDATYPLDKALAHFQRCLATHGATHEAAELLGRLTEHHCQPELFT